MRNRIPEIMSLLIGVAVVVVAANLWSDRSGGETPATSTSLELASEPSFRFLRFETNADERVAVLRLTNATAATIYFYGYSSDYPQQWFERKTNGQWVDCGWHWCGTGMELHELASGKSIEFRVSPSDVYGWGDYDFEESEPLRVGIKYGFDQDAINVRLWSETIELGEVSEG